MPRVFLPWYLRVREPFRRANVLVCVIMLLACVIIGGGCTGICIAAIIWTDVTKNKHELSDLGTVSQAGCVLCLCAKEAIATWNSIKEASSVDFLETLFLVWGYS